MVVHGLVLGLESTFVVIFSVSDVDLEKASFSFKVCNLVLKVEEVSVSSSLAFDLILVHRYNPISCVFSSHLRKILGLG